MLVGTYESADWTPDSADAGPSTWNTRRSRHCSPARPVVDDANDANDAKHDAAAALDESGVGGPPGELCKPIPRFSAYLNTPESPPPATARLHSIDYAFGNADDAQRGPSAKPGGGAVSQLIAPPKQTRLRRVGRRTSRPVVLRRTLLRAHGPALPLADPSLQVVSRTTTNTTDTSAAPLLPAHLAAFSTVFGADALSALQDRAKQDALGQRVPPPIANFVHAVSDVASALRAANALRAALNLPAIPVRADRVALRRQVALAREALYVGLAAVLALPDAPTDAPDTDDEEQARAARTKISLTAFNAPMLIRKMQEVIPHEQLRKLQPAMGEDGAVVWVAGVGRMRSAGPAMGYRPCGVCHERGVHVFLDYSNILYGLVSYLTHADQSSLPPKHQRVLSLPLLSCLFTRGRHTPRGSMHAVASSPLRQDLDPLVRLGWEVSVLKRVELEDVEVDDPDAANPVPKAHGQATSGIGVGIRRYKEQGVDEILHLKMLQTINAVSSSADDAEGDGHGARPGTIVLGTGDARGGQFNSDGFVGAVREALARGWAVELWSFKSGLSRAWADTAKRQGWGRHFAIRTLDPFGELLVEVGEED